MGILQKKPADLTCGETIGYTFIVTGAVTACYLVVAAGCYVASEVVQYCVEKCKKNEWKVHSEEISNDDFEDFLE